MTIKEHIQNSLPKVNNYDRYAPYAVPNTNYSMSVQASSFHYCEPRTDLGELSEYSSYEIAILDADKHLVNVQEKLPEIFSLGVFEEGDSPVAGYVTLEVLEKIENLLTQKESV
jgi:hypothetical protein